MQVIESERRMLVSPLMQAEHVDEASATIYLRSNGTRIRIPRKLYELLRRFSFSRTIADALGTDTPPASALSALEKLKEKGFLIFEEDREGAFLDRLVTAPPVRMFDAPMQKPDEPPRDVVVIGFPFDHGCQFSAGARGATLELREASLHLLYRVSPKTGEPLGWYDADRRAPLLKRVGIGDCGDLVVDHGESQTSLHRRLSRLLQNVVHKNALPVLVGGDATGSLSVIRHLQGSGPIGVVRIGGREFDRPDSGSGAVSVETLGSVLTRCEKTVGFWSIANSAGRLEGCEQSDAGIRHIPAARAVRDIVTDIRAHLPKGASIYLGVDISVLNMGLADHPSGSHGSMNFDELKTLIVALGENFRITGLDLVGMNPVHVYWNVISVYALHILVTAISAAKDGFGAEG